MTGNREEAAVGDPLTGLASRAGFQSELEHSIAEAAATGEDVALIMFDIDRFKQFNLTLGHRSGDKLLVAIADRVARVLRGKHYFARVAGDEFAVVARVPPGALADRALAQAIFAAFSNGFVIGGREVRVHVTLGFACAPRHASTADGLHRCAVVALQAGKMAGQNRISVFDEQIPYDFEARWAMSDSLREAIDAKAIDVHYQPIVDLRTGRIAGVEALARWLHPDLGIVPPERFIEIAEENRLIHHIDNHVLARACTETRNWIRDGDIEFFSVNLSPPRVWSDDNASAVLALLAELAIDPRTLVLEVTERLALLDSSHVRRGLEALRAKGVRLALDDFGAGFSNLSYLNRFPIDRIKIDRSLVADIEDQEFVRIIIRSVTDLAHQLGLLVIVEGVETTAQRQILADIGCDYAQGFWFSQALPVVEMQALLLTHSGAVGKAPPRQRAPVL